MPPYHFHPSHYIPLNPMAATVRNPTLFFERPSGGRHFLSKIFNDFFLLRPFPFRRSKTIFRGEPLSGSPFFIDFSLAIIASVQPPVYSTFLLFSIFSPSPPLLFRASPLLPLYLYLSTSLPLFPLHSLSSQPPFLFLFLLIPFFPCPLFHVERLASLIT